MVVEESSHKGERNGGERKTESGVRNPGKCDVTETGKSVLERVEYGQPPHGATTLSGSHISPCIL